ncbi:DNA-directed RNA polymerase III subunit RPC6 [Chamberlinius hualienensis]
MMDTNTSVLPEDRVEVLDLENRIIDLCQRSSQGITDTHLKASLPNVNAQQRATAINRLLSRGKIDLLKQGNELRYRLKDTEAAKNVRGSDNEEKIVYLIIKNAGNKGIWIREIRNKSNLVETHITKILKNLESRKLIKSVKSVSLGRRKVYMLYDVEPDQTVTGGSWYSDQDFEAEFVKVLNEQCFRYLTGKLKVAQNSTPDPLLQRSMASASASDVLQFITSLGISKVELTLKDIESILNTLVYDGKAVRTENPESSSAVDSSSEIGNVVYRCIKPLTEPCGFVKTPCGHCPLIRECSIGGVINPKTSTFHPAKKLSHLLQVIEELTKTPSGISDIQLRLILPNTSIQQRLTLINKLLTKGKIELLQKDQQLLYRLKDNQSAGATKGCDTEEKVIHQIISTVGNTGITKYEIRIKSSLTDKTVTACLKSLEKKMLIKTVKAIRSGRNVTVFMLRDLEPDQSITGGILYNNQQFETEFVKILTDQSHRFLLYKFETAKQKTADPLLQRSMDSVSVNEVLEYITGLGISKVKLAVKDMASILNALVFDGKITQVLSDGNQWKDDANGETKFRCVKPLTGSNGFLNIPCGYCPVVRECAVGGVINPVNCPHFKNWVEF